MNKYEEIINMVSETNNIPIEYIDLDIQFHKPHHVQEYTYLKIGGGHVFGKDRIYHSKIPEKVYELLGISNPNMFDFRRMQISLKWGYFILKVLLDEDLATELREQEQEYRKKQMKER